ncbi:hypothetical protein AB833_07270 [Chromatiales bacterium (ex Bugula neritina AB1)]|nr:hypothetical protein AB833_07270 [Chromatiales bacterium (ex Bugula neritina AB1)]
MQYMALIYSTENSGPQPGTAEFGAYIQAYQEFTEETQKDGVFVAGDALQPTSTSTTVTRENGKLETTDGPFAETKEQLGGYYLFECKDLDEALAYAARIPTTAHGRVEVRPVMVFDV